MEVISDDVLRRASKGDIGSFEIIYRAMADFVYNVVFRVVNNREDAQEVTQEVFLVLYRKLKSFRFESSLKTWVYRIAVNRAINFAKKSAREKMKISEYEKELSIVFRDGGSDEEREKTVEALFKSVEPDQRACLVLRSVEGLSYKEIASALRININTVRSRLRRARERLISLERGSSA